MLYDYYYIEYGYISNLERISSEDNSTINFTCHLACQTDFITGCSITLVDACGKNFIQFCAVENSQTFSPRQCSVSFQDLPPSRYEFLAKVRSNSQLQLEENILNMTGTFITAGKSLLYHINISIQIITCCYYT